MNTFKCHKCGKEMPKRNCFFETYYDKNGKHYSVDFDFCMKATKAGFKIHVDPDSEIQHIGDNEVVDKKTFYRHNAQYFKNLTKKT